MSHLQNFLAAAQQRADALPDFATHRRQRRSLRAALGSREQLAVIAEFKRRSPSQGLLAADVDPAAYARRAVGLGAAALSVLTEPRFFDGSYADLELVRAAVDVPILAKDFIVDRRQVAAAARHGADAVLLVLRGLHSQCLAELLAAAQACDLEVVLECHDAAEVGRALAVTEAIVGINNRDLDSLEVDLARARQLLPLVPATRCAIAESGYSSAAELRELQAVANGVLIGTSLMRGVDLAALLTKGRP